MSTASNINHSQRVSYVLVAQANCRRQRQSTLELAQYLNSAMKRYRLNEDNSVLTHKIWTKRDKGKGPHNKEVRPRRKVTKPTAQVPNTPSMSTQGGSQTPPQPPTPIHPDPSPPI